MLKYKNLNLIILQFLIVALPATVMADNVCFTCHDKNLFKNKVVHQPLAKGKCNDCHNPHVAHYKGLLDQQGADLCYDCHKQEEESFGQGMVHSPVRQGKCLSCHEAHASSRKGLLKDKLSTTCFECHKELQVKYKQTHAPYAKGQCFSCHLPHSSQYGQLLKNTEDKLCSSCHMDQDLRKAHPKYPGHLQNCLTCHNPHGSERKGLIRNFLHAPYEEGCGDCHGKGDERVGTQTCLQCHEEVGDKMFMTHTHLSGKSVNKCVVCHSPHASDEKSLLRKKQEKVCRTCHENTRKRYEDTLYKHENADKCTECHDVHGSNQLVMMKGDGNTICTRCHETQGQFTHPIGDKVKDPRTGQSVTCISCHTPMGSDYKYELKMSGSKDLCVQCHKRY
ncbi:MAG: hypothetical protein KQH63_17390 [Desulfobulbaceae bacterium]|nr:hypothetical protein [Desulfobulbaceae bacterium]